MRIYNFETFVNELNHQTPDILSVNSPGYGQGAHHGNWGVNYGKAGKGVRHHFGDKQDKTDPQFPQPKKGVDVPRAVFDPTTGELMHEDDVKELIQDFNLLCKKNKDCIEIDNIDSKSIEFARNYIKKHS